MTLWLDQDGVLADFNRHYKYLFNNEPTRWPEPETVDWKLIESKPTFYRDIPVMSDAHSLYEYCVLFCIQHRITGPAILTGLPSSIDACSNQKVDWRNAHFPHAPIQCCAAKDKFRFCQPGDILVDDYLRYRVAWEDAGGVFVHHTSAAQSIAELGELASWGIIGELSSLRG